MTNNPDDTSPHAPSGSVGDTVEPVGPSPQENAAFPVGGYTKGDNGSDAADKRGGLGGFAWAFLVLLWGYTIYQLGTFWNLYENYSYGWFVPLLCLCLFWERWKRRPRRDPVRAASGTFAVLGGCALAMLPAVLFLTVIPQSRFGVWLFALASTTITIITLYFVGGRSYARHFIFPALFFLIAVPWPGQIEGRVINNMSELNAAISTRLANHLGTPAVRSGVIIETGSGPVGVDEACSGIRSFQASLMVSLFLGELFRFGFLRRLLLLFGGVGIALFSNVVRTTYLVRTCDVKGMDAVNLYHDQAGFVILGITFSGLLLLAWGLSRSEKREVESEGGWHRRRDKEIESGSLAEAGDQRAEVETEEPSSFPPAASAGALRWALAAVIAWVVGIEIGIDLWFRPVGKQAAAKHGWSLKLPSQNPEFRLLPISKDVQNNLRYDAGTLAEWRDAAGHSWRLYYFNWRPEDRRYGAVSPDAQQLGHTTDFCLVNAGMILQTNFGMQLNNINGVQMVTGMQRLLSRGRKFHVCSAYWKAGRTAVEAIPQLDPSGHGIRLVYHALTTRDRGRNEQRVIKMGVWEMASDEEATAAFKEYLTQMVVREEEQKLEVRSQK